MWICKCSGCGIGVQPTADAVLAHYEKYHFSEFAHNRDAMRRMPKAFVKDVSAKEGAVIRAAVTKPVVHRQPKVQDPVIIQRRQANLPKIIDYIEEKELIWDNKGSEYFTCVGCGRRLSHGKRIKKSRKDYIDVCPDCYKSARQYMREHNPRKLKAVYYPVNGMNKYWR